MQKICWRGWHESVDRRHFDALMDKAVEAAPRFQLVTIDQTGEMAAFLLSNRTGAVTGQTICVDEAIISRAENDRRICVHDILEIAENSRYHPKIKKKNDSDRTFPPLAGDAP